MTHEELLEKIDYNLDKEIWFQDMGYALRAVVELHKPCDCDEAHCDYCTDLGEIFSNQPYPCPTIQAIEKELR